MRRMIRDFLYREKIECYLTIHTIVMVLIRSNKQIAEEVVEYLSGRFEYIIKPADDFINKLHCRIWDEIIEILSSNFCEQEYYAAMYNLNLHHLKKCDMGRIRDFIRIYRIGNYSEFYSNNYSNFEAATINVMELNELNERTEEMLYECLWITMDMMQKQSGGGSINSFEFDEISEEIRTGFSYLIADVIDDIMHHEGYMRCNESNIRNYMYFYIAVFGTWTEEYFVLKNMIDRYGLWNEFKDVIPEPEQKASLYACS